jgi:hypothetical protein
MQSNVGVKNQDIDSCLMEQEHLISVYSMSPQSTFRRKQNQISFIGVLRCCAIATYSPSTK